MRRLKDRLIISRLLHASRLRTVVPISSFPPMFIAIQLGSVNPKEMKSYLVVAELHLI